ncbi:MAG: TlpA disulfide reductase family protein [Actinomycetota bacterium]|jgi:cytochrome c biogenesis protein CcmG/thiol:disulfide interchange protein DsbE|nr:TlpA disulfide reductase family protein [Actinomycetota bacterium]
MSTAATPTIQRRHLRHPVRWLAIVLGLVVAGGLAVMLPRLGQNPSTQVAADSPLLGKPAPSFSLREANGGAIVSSATLRGHYSIVYFFATWCPVCVAEVPNLVSFYWHWHTRGVELLGIGYDDPAAAEAQFARQEGISWPLLVDPDGQVALHYGIFGIPETFVVGPGGTVLAKLVGAVGTGQLGAVVERVMNGSTNVSVRGGAVVPTSAGQRTGSG